MPSAWVIEIKGDNSQTQRGLFEFAQIPSVGDRIMLREGDRLCGFGVVQIEHFPARVPPEDGSKEPSTTIYVHWLKEYPVE
ncbi:MAG: hypothetical protein ABSC92_09110 [Rhizomicrobium sp.]|jgi:hypothetical protein